jgi:pimeloyl-ACP methyl ester carboxylesterase
MEKNDMKPSVLIASLALIILCGCAVAGAGAVESCAEADAVLDEWTDLEVTPTATVNLTDVGEVGNVTESCSDPDAVLDEWTDPEVTPTVAVDPPVMDGTENATESYIEPDTVLDEWNDPEVIPTAAVDPTDADGVENLTESCSDPDVVLDGCDDPEVAPTVEVDPTAVNEVENVTESCPGPDVVLDGCDDPEITPTVAEEGRCGSALTTEYAAATTGSLQPLFKAPWEGEKRITQGTHGSTSHYDHGTWDNTYALDIASLTRGEKFNVLAPYDGIVRLVDKEGTKYPSSGKVVVIEHTFDGSKYYTVYLHLSEIFVDNGSELKQGQVFAISGNTGTSSTGVHLHFHLFGTGKSWNSHTQPIERFELKRTGVDDDFRIYNMSKGDLNDSIVRSGIFESSNVPVSKEVVKTRDTVLVLDASGSMYGKPVTVMKEAAKIFCSEVLNASEKNRVAVVVYSSDVERTLDFTADLNSLNETIDLIQAGGGTNIAAAIDSASLLLSSSDADAQNIVLMTDGLPQSGKYSYSGQYSSLDISGYYAYANYVYEQCSELKQSYNIYTLGFFHSVSEREFDFGHRFLDDIQNKGYYEVTDADELKFIFGELAEDITKEDYPIIVVHGIMGGTLYNCDGDLVWLLIDDPDKLPGSNDSFLEKIQEIKKLIGDVYSGNVSLDLGQLNINTQLETPNNGRNLNAPGIKREYGVLGGFYDKKLVDSLCEQFPDRAVYFYSYDWRQSNNDSAVGLNDLINDIKAQTGYSKVDLVCHSMGGLVASSYVSQHGTNDVRYIITLATPYEGSPEIISRILREKPLGTRTFMNKALSLLLVECGVTKELMAGFPSCAELAPTERYFMSTNYLKYHGTHLPKTYEQYYGVMTSIFGAENYDSAVAFQNSINDVLLDLDNTYFAIATNVSTVETISIDTGGSPETLETIRFRDSTPDNKGDGTVSYRSATMNYSLLNYSDIRDSAGNSRYREFDTDHTGILSDGGALLWIKNILSQTSNPYEEIDKINYPGYLVIRIACPINVTIDVNGEILSSDPEMGSTHIPNGRLDFIGDNGVLIYLEDTGTVCNITIVGTGEGTMDYGIRWYDADNTLTETRSLEAVPITTTTTITTTTDYTGSTVLNIDSDGDGTFDTQWSVDDSGKTVVVDLKPAYTSYCDGGSDTTSFAITSGSVSFWRSAGITGINFPDGVTGMIILNDPSPEITPPENTYAIFDISAPPFEGSAEINFVIPSAILAGSGYGKTDVVMKHYTNDTWQNLPTYFVGEERGAASYTATTTSFSSFAIVYETGGASVADTDKTQEPSESDETVTAPKVDETQPTGEETVTTGEEQPTVPSSEETTTEAETTTAKSPGPLLGMLIGLGAAALLRRRT